jgi:putative iron-dependent peroxidase
VIDEVHGLRSFDLRDLLGFVDGTENLPDLSAWDALPVEEQERAIGTTKLSDIELRGDVRPSNSPVALNSIVDEDGTEYRIVRYNMPFGRVGWTRTAPTEG